jgi:hypothetical protein
MRTPKSNKGFDEFVEQFFDFVLTTDSIAKLVEKDVFVFVLEMAAPATAKRMVAFALQQCAERGEPLPIRLAEIARSYLVPGTTRNRVHRRDEMAKAAAYQAKFPRASLREIARIAGVDPTVVRDWRRQFAYKREMVKRLIPIAQQSYRQYIRRFGSPFAEAGLPEPEGLRLARLRAIIEDALSRGVPADLLTANAALDASSGRSRPAIPI